LYIIDDDLFHKSHLNKSISKLTITIEELRTRLDMSDPKYDFTFKYFEDKGKKRLF